MVSDKKTKSSIQSKGFTTEKSNIEKKVNFLYKILVSNGDYIKLQEEVISHLNDGWSLVGGVALAIHADPYSKMTIFSQAIQKTI